MKNYRSYGRRKNKKGKWIIVLLFLSFAAFKAYNRNLSPAFTYAEKTELAIPFVEPQTENSDQLPAKSSETAKPMSEPNLPQIIKITQESNSEIAKSLGNILTSLETNTADIIQQRDRLNNTLSTTMSQEQLKLVKKQLSSLSKKWLFSKDVIAGDKLCTSYKVKPGDTALEIGKTFNVPYQILMRINNISNPRALRAGETIKVINGPFHCKINRSNFTMDLFLQDTFVRSFTVGIGKAGMETPTGRWIVKPGGKLISPTWTDPDTGKTYGAQDPDYPLGARWIGLEGLEGAAKGRTGFAIHGTNNPQQLGMAESRGCIRLYDEHVKLMYDLLMPGASQVIVE